MIGLSLDVHHHDLFLTPDLFSFALGNYRRLLFTGIVVYFLKQLIKMRTRQSTGSFLFGLSLNTMILGMTIGKIVYETQPKGEQAYDCVEHFKNFLTFSYRQIGLNLNLDAYRSPGSYLILSAALLFFVYWNLKFLSRHRTFRFLLIALAAFLYVAEIPISERMSKHYSGKMFDVDGDSARFKISFIPRILLFTIVFYRLFLFVFDSAKYFISLVLRIALIVLCVGICVGFYQDYVDKNSFSSLSQNLERVFK